MPDNRVKVDEIDYLGNYEDKFQGSIGLFKLDIIEGQNEQAMRDNALKKYWTDRTAKVEMAEDEQYLPREAKGKLTSMIGSIIQRRLNRDSVEIL